MLKTHRPALVTVACLALSATLAAAPRATSSSKR